MANFFGIEVDTATMTLEELEEARKKTRDMLVQLDYEICTRKMAKHKYSSIRSTPTEI